MFIGMEIILLLEDRMLLILIEKKIITNTLMQNCSQVAVRHVCLSENVTLIMPYFYR